MKHIFKGTLLWLTAFSVILYIIGVDSLNIYEFLGWTATNAALIVACKHALSLREFYILSGYRYLHTKYNL